MGTYNIKKLNLLSEDFLFKFVEFLKENNDLLVKQIGNTGIVIEADGYQLSIQSVEY